MTQSFTPFIESSKSGVVVVPKATVAPDFSTLVASLTRTRVYKQDSYSHVDQLGSDYDGPVAIKVRDQPLLSNSSSNVDKQTHRLVHEANVYRALSPHPHIPLFIDCALAAPSGPHTSSESAAQHYPVLVTQFIKGASLDRLRYTFPLLRLDLVLRVTYQLTHVLEHIHRHGFVYGDLKLSNVLLDVSGFLWLIDYESAVLAVDLVERLDLLAARVTEHVRAPELYCSHTLVMRNGTSDCENSFAVDVWGLGVLLLELLLGTTPLVSLAKLALESEGGVEPSSLFTAHLSQCLEDIHQRYRRWTGSGFKYTDVQKPLAAFITALLMPRTRDRLGCAHGTTCIWTAVRTHPLWAVVETKCSQLLKEMGKAQGERATWWPEEYEEEMEDLTLGL